MGTYDAYWDMAMENAKFESERRKNLLEKEYFIIIDEKGNRVSDKCLTEEKAINTFVTGKGNGIFTWDDFRHKGFSVRYVDVKKIQSEIDKLNSLLY